MIFGITPSVRRQAALLVILIGTALVLTGCSGWRLSPEKHSCPGSNSPLPPPRAGQPIIDVGVRDQPETVKVGTLVRVTLPCTVLEEWAAPQSDTPMVVGQVASEHRPGGAARAIFLAKVPGTAHITAPVVYPNSSACPNTPFSAPDQCGEGLPFQWTLTLTVVATDMG